MEPKERRTLADFRRSGAIEAIVGGSGAEHLSHAMGNTLSASNALFKIYAPVNLASIREVQAARRLGRPKLAALDESEKVGTMAVRKLERPWKYELNGGEKVIHLSKVNGGSDGARTRDLRRDRPAL